MEKRNISVAAKNGYTLEKVRMAKRYLDEIGSNKRTFDFKRLVEMYNEVLGTNDIGSGCKCQAPKYYNGIQNYYNYGKLTLINNHLASESDFEDVKEDVIPIENADNRINLGNEAISEPSVELKDGEPRPSKGLEGNEVELPTVIKEEENEAIVEAKKKVGRPRKNIDK